VTVDAAGSTFYQSAEITHYDSALEYYKSNYSDLIERVVECLRNRLKVQHTDLLTHVLTILTPFGWDKSEDGSFAYQSLDYLVSMFQKPLEKAGINTTLMQEEWDDMIDYAKRYLNLVQEDYTRIWWKLFNSTVSAKWTNILGLVNLLFCIPASNGKIERGFSLLKQIKTVIRTSISGQRLDELLRIAGGPPLCQWNPTAAMNLWWKDKCRRTPSDTRAAQKSPIPEEDPKSDSFSLEEWEKWINDPDTETSDINDDTDNVS